jgi:glycosyltransferase involved in cell wall biosynthesis
MSNILYISYDGMTDPLGQSQVLPYLIGLSQKGYQVTLLSTEKKENFAKRYALIAKITKEHNIDWQYVFYTKKPPVVSTLRDVQKLYQRAKQLHQQKSFAITHCRSYIAALIGKRLKRKFGLKFIFDMRGFWADERVDGGLWNLKNPVFNQVYQFFKRQERSFLQEADYTISLTHHAKDEITSWNLPNLAPIQVIPCCVDLDLFSPSTDSITSKPYTLSYLGSTGTWYMLTEMLIFFKRMLEVKPDANFLFITTDKPEVILEEAKQQEIPASKLTIQSAERAEVPDLISQSEASIFFIKPLFSKKASSATKMGEILAMGVPVITNDGVGDHPYLFEKYNLGILLSDFSEQQFAQAIHQLPHLPEIPPKQLREAAEEYFSLEKGIEKYLEVYQHLLN